MDYVYDYHTNHQLIKKKETYTKKGLSGLVNLGNKCFLNSILQCLSNTLKLTDYFLSNKFLEDDPENLNKKKEEYYIILSYFNLINNIWETNQLIKPKSFVENISKVVKKYFTLQQQDSHECLLYILDLLHNGLSYEIDVNIKGTVKNDTDILMKTSLESWKAFYEKKYSYIIELFNGMFYNRIKCNTCNHHENVFEPYNTLSIDIPDTTETVDIKTCLDRTLNEIENIPSWVCNNCSNNGCSKGSKLWSIPNYLIIHLKRFNHNGNGGNGNKVFTPINFPIEDLNLTEYMSTDKNDPNNYIYSLYAVNYHSGGVSSGHYWSCCRNLDNNWYLFNDGHVSKFKNTKDLLTKDAYILFYYRKFIKNPIQI